MVRVPAGTDPRVDGLWMIVTSVGPDYISGVVPCEDEIPKLVRLPRAAIESIWESSPVHARVL